ncbi:chaplin [Kitasatospora sp. NPDC101801]|uniref:chaplin n=1 Tax=unclassified Kitasatospora TaxID=2633591 RepID=UPI0032544EE8
MKVKKIVAIAAATGGLVLAGAGAAAAHGGAAANGFATNSPGVLSGNNVQVPVHVPVNLCGNTVSVIGLLNPAFGNNCANF